MRIYRLFSMAYAVTCEVSFEERRAFFELLRQRQLESEPPFFSKQLAETCPCCGYPIFDREATRNHNCLICGWPYQSLSSKTQLRELLLSGRKDFEEEWIAFPLTDIQPWLGWDTPVDLALHQAIVSFFNRMVGESQYDLLNHLLDACHQLLSYKAFRRDVGLQLWESHKELLDEKEDAVFDFNEEEIEKTFFEYIDTEQWDYLNYFLDPRYCLTVSYDPVKDVLLRFDVAETSALSQRDWIYFVLNLQVDDPLYLQIDRDPLEQPVGVILCDFTGKQVGFVPAALTPQVLKWLEKGGHLSAVIEQVEAEGQSLHISVALLCFKPELLA